MLASVAIAEAEYPPPAPVAWRAWTLAGDFRETIVSSQSWFHARELAAREFGLLVHEVDAERDGATDAERVDASMGVRA